MRATLACGAVVIAACLAWATLPVQVPSSFGSLSSPFSSAAEIDDQHFDETKFDENVFGLAKLWNPPPSEEADLIPEVADRPRPLNVQLIGIIHEAGMLRAVLYVPEEDKLLIVAEGEKVKGYNIVSIHSEGIEFSDGRSSRKIHLREENS